MLRNYQVKLDCSVGLACTSTTHKLMRVHIVMRMICMYICNRAFGLPCKIFATSHCQCCITHNMVHYLVLKLPVDVCRDKLCKADCLHERTSSFTLSKALRIAPSLYPLSFSLISSSFLECGLKDSEPAAEFLAASYSLSCLGLQADNDSVGLVQVQATSRNTQELRARQTSAVVGHCQKPAPLTRSHSSRSFAVV